MTLPENVVQQLSPELQQTLRRGLATDAATESSLPLTVTPEQLVGFEREIMNLRSLDKPLSVLNCLFKSAQIQSPASRGYRRRVAIGYVQESNPFADADAARDGEVIESLCKCLDRTRRTNSNSESRDFTTIFAELTLHLICRGELLRKVDLLPLLIAVSGVKKAPPFVVLRLEYQGLPDQFSRFLVWCEKERRILRYLIPSLTAAKCEYSEIFDGAKAWDVRSRALLRVVDKGVSAAYQRAGLAEESLSTLLDACARKARMDRPQCTVATTLGSVPTHVPGAESRGKSPKVVVAQPSAEESVLFEDPPIPISLGLTGLRRCLQSPNVSQTKRALQKFKTDEAAEQLLAEFALFELHCGNALTTTSRYVLDVGRTLLPRLDLSAGQLVCDEGLSEAIAEGLTDLSEEIAVGDAGLKSRMFKRGYRAFLDFLRATGRLKNTAGLKRTLQLSGLEPVKAAIITLDELHNLLRHVAAFVDDHLHRKALRAYFQLLWYGGMRRDEAYARHRSDFIADDRILMRPRKGAKLKSAASYRNVPFRLLAGDTVADEVFAFARTGAEEVPVFAGLRHENGCLMSKDKFFVVATRLLQSAVDGDVSLHAFRHTCASFSLLRIAGYNRDKVSAVFRAHPETLAWLSHSEGLHASLSATPCRANAQEIVCALLGHTDPATTAKAYLHIQDLLA